MLGVTSILNAAVNDFDARKSARCTWVFAVSRTHCKNKECFSALRRTSVTCGFCCLEQLDADWLNSCVCLEALHSDCFYCMWYLFVTRNPAF